MLGTRIDIDAIECTSFDEQSRLAQDGYIASVAHSADRDELRSLGWVVIARQPLDHARR